MDGIMDTLDTVDRFFRSFCKQYCKHYRKRKGGWCNKMEAEPNLRLCPIQEFGEINNYLVKVKKNVMQIVEEYDLHVNANTQGDIRGLVNGKK